MWLYVYGELNDGKYELLHIPFGTLLVSRNDVWHEGFCGHVGNLHLHANIWPMHGYSVAKGGDHLTYGAHENKEYLKEKVLKEIDYKKAINVAKDDKYIVHYDVKLAKRVEILLESFDNYKL